MKKMRLELDALAVKSFVTATEDEEAGTVKGHSYEGDNSALLGSCVNTCQLFCPAPGTTNNGGSHVQTCAYSCAQNTVCNDTCVGVTMCYCGPTNDANCGPPSTFVEGCIM